MQPDTTREGSLGPIIGTVIILLVIIIGGLYFLKERTKTDVPAQTGSTPTASAIDADTAAISAQSSSDDASAIEADLNATNVDMVDAGLTQ